MSDPMPERRDSEESPGPADVIHAFVDLASGHPDRRRDRRALAYLAGLVVAPLIAHCGLNLQARREAPDAAQLAAKLEEHESKLTAIQSDVRTIGGNVDTLTRVLIGDRSARMASMSAAPTPQPKE